MTPRAVLFDMDGTLAISEETHHRALDDVLREQGIEKPVGFDSDMTGQSMRASFDYLKERTSLTLGYAELAAAKYRAFLARIHDLHWRPGAREAMLAAQAAGCQIAVVTNSDRILLDASLRVLDLHRPDQITVSRNDVRDGKPQAEPYQRAAWLLGLAACNCVVVEDSHTGSTAGLRAGMRVIGWPEASANNMQFPEGYASLTRTCCGPPSKTNSIKSKSYKAPVPP